MRAEFEQIFRQSTQGLLSDYFSRFLYFGFWCRRKKFDGIDELYNDKGYMCRPGQHDAVMPASCSSPRFSTHTGDASSQYSDFDADTDHYERESVKAEKLESSRESPVHNDENHNSGSVALEVADSDKLETLQHGESHKACLFHYSRLQAHVLKVSHTSC